MQKATLPRPQLGEVMGWRKPRPHAGEDTLFEPFYVIAGGALEDDEDDDEEDEDDESDDDSDDDESKDDKGEWTPPTKEQWEAEQAKLRKANAQAKKHRLAAKQVGSTASTDVEKAKESAQQAAEAKYKPIVVKTAARAALAEAGALKPERLIKLLDMDLLDIDEDGDVEGLDDEISSLKKEYPEFFETKAKRASRVSGAAKTRTGARPEAKSSAEIMAERFGR